MIPCPNLAFHTPHPDGYLGHLAWAREMSKTHRQKRCGACGLWVIWVPRKGATRAALNPAAFERACIVIQFIKTRRGYAKLHQGHG